jgi:hypothetical protein
MVVFTCDSWENEYFTGFGWRKNEMCKLSERIIKETEEHYLCERLEKLYYEYHGYDELRISLSLVDLLDGACTA